MRTSYVLAAALAPFIPASASAQDRSGGGATRGSPKAANLLIYRASGVKNTSDGNIAGVATSFHCTSGTNNPVDLRIVVRHFDGSIAADVTDVVSARRTYTTSTKRTTIFDEDSSLGLGAIAVSQGMVIICASSASVFCTAHVVDAASTSRAQLASRSLQ